MSNSHGAGAFPPVRETGHMHGDHARILLNKRVHKWSEELAGGMKTVRKMHADYVKKTPRVLGMDPDEGLTFAKEFEGATESMTALRTSHLLDGMLHSIPDMPDGEGIDKGIVIRHAMSNATGTDKGITNFFIPFTEGHGIPLHDWDTLCTAFADEHVDHAGAKEILLRHLERAYVAACHSEPGAASLKVLSTGVCDTLAALDASILDVKYIPWADPEEHGKRDVIIGDVATGAAMARHTLECLAASEPQQKCNGRTVRLGTKVNEQLKNVLAPDWAMKRHCLRVKFCGVKGGGPDTRGHRTYTHELVLFYGARHPTEHTLLSHVIGYTGAGEGAHFVHDEHVELFEGASDWREDAVCIPKCISAMRNARYLGEYERQYRQYAPLMEATSDWISDQLHHHPHEANVWALKDSLLSALDVAYIYRQPEPKDGYHQSFEHAFNILSVNVCVPHGDYLHRHGTYIVLSMLIPPMPRMRKYDLTYHPPPPGRDSSWQRILVTDDLKRLYVFDPQISGWYGFHRGRDMYLLRNAAGIPYEMRVDTGHISTTSRVSTFTRATWLENLEKSVHWLRALVSTVHSEDDKEAPQDQDMRRDNIFFYGNKYSIRQDTFGGVGKGWYEIRRHQDGFGYAREQFHGVFQEAAITPSRGVASLAAPVGNGAAPTPVMQQQTGLLPPNPRRRQRMEGGGGSRCDDGGVMLDTIAVELSDIKRFLGEFVNAKK